MYEYYTNTTTTNYNNTNTCNIKTFINGSAY